MKSTIAKRSSSTTFSSNNDFERAYLKGVISSLGYGYIADPALKKLVLEEDEVTKQTHHVFLSFAFPPSHVSFSSAALNPFINQLVAHPSYVIEVEKEYLEPSFEALRSKLGNLVLLNPSEEKRTQYYEPGVICLYPLMSKSPVNKEGTARSEKLLVDLIVSHRYRCLFSGPDIAQALTAICNDYAVNFKTLFAYASRKRKTAEVYEALEGVAQGQIKEMLHAIKEKLPPANGGFSAAA